MEGIWFGYLAIVTLIIVSVVLGYLDHRSRRRERRAH